jgi:hypothetical protein
MYRMYQVKFSIHFSLNILHFLQQVKIIAPYCTKDRIIFSLT